MVTNTAGLGGVLVLGAIFLAAMIGVARAMPAAEELPDEPSLGVVDIQMRLDHTDAHPIRSAEHAHKVMQRHINCDFTDCPAKRDAVLFLERAGKLRRDSGRA